MMSAPPRHIAIVTSGSSAGGAERVIALLSASLIEDGSRVSLITFDQMDAPVFHPLPQAVSCIRLGRAGDRGGGTAIVRRALRLRRALARERPDLLISFLTKINAIALAATLGMRIPVIACERNNPERQGAHPAWNLALHLLYRRAAAIVCQTEASLRCIPAAARGKAVVIPNPIAPYPIVPQATRPSRLVAVGRLTHQKGFDLLIQAFAEIAPRHPDWQLDIWGEGEDGAALQQQIARSGAARQIALCGCSAIPGGWLEQASAFVLSSRYEGFPNALAEAMAAGLPVVAAACDFGPADLIEDGRTGLLCPANDVAGLATALDRLLGDAAERARLGQAAATAAVRFAGGPILAHWRDLLSSAATVDRPATSPLPRPAHWHIV